MKKTIITCLAVAAWLASSPVGAQEALSDKHPVRASLVADVEQAGLGEEFRVGLALEMAPGWHIYWTYPGNTGKPTRVAFSSDERYTKVLEPAFPAPEVFDAEVIDDLSFGYAKQVLIPATAMVFDAPTGGRTRISAQVSWLACKQACITGRAQPSLELAVGEGSKPSDQKTNFDRVAAKLPAPLGAEAAHLESVTYEAGRWQLRLALPGVSDPEAFVPAWLPGAACKIHEYRVVRPDSGPAHLELTLQGAECLPGVGGVIRGRLAGGQDAKAGPLAVRGWAPEQAEAPEAGTPDVGPPATAGLAVEVESLWLMLLFALLGGLLLNVMPCVIPVVIPKLLHVVRTAQKTADPAERRRLLWTNALAYTGGVLATLLSLAGLVIILKHVGIAVGWGFQFQNPWFLVFMIALMTVLGLGMLHVYPLQSASHTDDLKQLRKTRRKNPLLESFLTGLLVTFLGTPCTAPMLGPALGYAFSSSDVEIALLLVTVGLGLSTPFLLLGAWTGWTRVLPSRVTERYDRIMRGMAFLLFGTAVWLIGVVADAYGSSPAVNVIWFCLVLSAAAWVYGLIADVADDWKKRLLKLAPLLALAGAFGWWVLAFPADGAAHKSGRLESRVGIAWQAFNPAELAKLRRAGKTVFIDFTAEWCMNCKANERLVIETDETKALLDELDVISVKADNTRRDPVIHAWLKRHGRAGVPMYLIFPACQADDKAILLPEILTSDRLHSALKKAGRSRKACPPQTAPKSN